MTLISRESTQSGADEIVAQGPDTFRLSHEKGMMQRSPPRSAAAVHIKGSCNGASLCGIVTQTIHTGLTTVSRVLSFEPPSRHAYPIFRSYHSSSTFLHTAALAFFINFVPWAMSFLVVDSRTKSLGVKRFSFANSIQGYASDVRSCKIRASPTRSELPSG